ncbi:MAG: PilT/PilU family type 4a pilus ATPase [Planctomycetota bacterium]
MDHLHRLFAAAELFDASDIHLTSGEPPYFRLGGRLVATKEPPLNEDEITAVLRPTMTDAKWGRYVERGYVDYAFQTEVEVESEVRPVRYRMHLYRSRGTITGALRRIKLAMLDFESLKLPPIYEKAATLRPKGIVIVGGETGSGKSTSLACMLDYINARKPKHIVTIEDPIEYVLPNKMSKINQRELGEDFIDFPDALRAVVREDPDVILIGELRDSETVRAAIAAAETGHLVLTSLHTATAPEALHRILYFFPPHEEMGVRQNLASTLIAVMNQMLLPTLKEAQEQGVPSRVPATEVLINTSVVREYLRDPNHDDDLAGIISNPKTSSLSSSHDFNYSLKALFEKNWVGRDVAVGASMKPEQLEMQFRGVNM